MSGKKIKLILEEEVSKNANILGLRFVLAINYNMDEQIKFKTRYVIESHHDGLKAFMDHVCQTIQLLYIRMMLGIRIDLGVDVCSVGVIQAYFAVI